MKRKASLALLPIIIGGVLMSNSDAKWLKLKEAKNMVNSKIVTNFIKQTEMLPEDRVYLHTDKPFYKPGENIYFSGYVRDGESLKKSKESQILYVELINPKGNVEKKVSIVAFWPCLLCWGWAFAHFVWYVTFYGCCIFKVKRKRK